MTFGAVALIAGIVVGSPAQAQTLCDVSRVRGDFDSDGRVDMLVVGRGTSLKRCAHERSPLWTFRVRFGNGSGFVREIRAISAKRVHRPLLRPLCYPSCRPLAAVDLDRDGRDEVAIQIWYGASDVGVSVFRVSRTSIYRLRSQNPRHPFEFSNGGSVTHWHDVRCWGEDRVAQVDGAYLDAEGSARYRVTTYAFDGRVFRRVGGYRRTVRAPQRVVLPGRPCWPHR